jgi:hypothetical protein
MKKVRIVSGRHHWRVIEVPETWDEGRAMLIDAMSAKYDNSGGDAHRNSVAGRVAFGMFGNGPNSLVPNPTVALNFLLQKICEKDGAGLDPL